MKIVQALNKIISGDVTADARVLDEHAHDASLFEVQPAIVVFPKNKEDVRSLVTWVTNEKPKDHSLSITARSAGTCMSGGPLNDSIIVDFTKYMSHLGSIDKDHGNAQPGCMYRDFEEATHKLGVEYPAYPASKSICALGGIVANNGAGEKTLKYGKAEDYVERLQVVLRNGEVYTLEPLDRKQLESKIAQANNPAMSRKAQFEGALYQRMYDLLETNYDNIQAARPDVSKNSAGYALWNVWSRDTGIFDFTKLFTGSQGTLGLVTDIAMKLVPLAKHSKMLVVFMDDTEQLGELVNEAMAFDPVSIEAYDDATLKLALRFWFGFLRKRGLVGFVKMGLSFIPEMFKALFFGFPKLALLVQFEGDNEQELVANVQDLREKLRTYPVATKAVHTRTGQEKYWSIRRDSFALLREHAHGKRTAPFIDDVVVRPEKLPEFLPRLRSILEPYKDKLDYTLAGHAGDGNFHIIPLMDLGAPYSADLILEISEKAYNLVAEFNGSITAEHNDGIIRTPYLNKMYSDEILALFQEVKNIFDPQNIFNPGKKVNGSKEAIRRAIDGS